MKRTSAKSPAIPSVRWQLTVVAICLLAAVFCGRGLAISYWYNIGPAPIIYTIDGNLNEDSGRVAALAVDPSNANHWLIGAAQGGIWETTDAGKNWNPRTDAQDSMSMGALAFAPGNPSLVYAGTGEGNFRGDAYAGAGLLVSQNGGTIWQMLNTNFARTSFSRIRVNPDDSWNLVVATARGVAGIQEESSGYGNVPGAPPRGVFASTNGGTNFIRVLTGEATALEANPTNFNLQYAGLGEIYGDPTNGVYRTTDGWQTFQLIQGPWIETNFVYTNFPVATNIVISCTNLQCITNIIITYTNFITGTNILSGGRIAMASAPTDPNTLYVGVAETRYRYLSALEGIWVTTNAWDVNPTWSQLPTPPVFADSVSSPRYWYNFDLLVDRFDPSVVYLAEFDVWQYGSGGWTCLAGWNMGVPPFPIDEHVHPDCHAMAWVPGLGPTSRMLLGNDGGVYLSGPEVTAPWTSLNASLRITQFYKGAVDVTGANALDLGGAQDEFTSLFIGDPAWPKIVGGDGGDCAISASDPLNNWVISADTPSDNDPGLFNNQVQMFRTKNGGLDFDSGANDIADGLPFSSQFYVHSEKAPYNDDLLIAGTATLWRCTNYFSGTLPSWSSNGPTMYDTNGAPMPISAVAFAPSDTSGLIYAFGTEDGQLRVTANGGGLWTNPDPAQTLPGRYISGLAFSPINTNTLYVTYSGFDESTPGHPGHLFKTGNAFAATPTWTNISPPVDLPNNCLAIDPILPGTIYVGADVGVWGSGDGGGTWTHYGPSSGMPNVAVYDLRMTAGGQVTAFTHGRGAYLLTPINIPIIVLDNIRNIHPIIGCLTCPPDIAWLNPGDEVSVNVPLRGELPLDTVDLQVTLMSSPGITPITGTQDYGVVRGQGAAVSRVFQFIAGAAAGGPAGPSFSCGDTVQAVFQLQDQGMSLGQVTIPFKLGEPSHPLVEDFNDALPASGLPNGWSSSVVGSGVPWTVTTNQPANLADTGEDSPTPPPSNNSVMTPDPSGISQSYLTSAPFNVATPQAQLYFREAFVVSNAFDGLILEIAIGAQPFEDIIQAGGSFASDGYNMVLKDNNPLGPRHGW